MPQGQESVPHGLEVWAQVEEDNAFFKRWVVMSTAWAFVALLLAAYSVHVALTKPLAFVIGDDGHALLAGHLRDQDAPSTVEVRWVAQEFLSRSIGYNSLTVERDLAAAFNLMTPAQQRKQSAIIAAYPKEHGGEDFVTTIKKQRVQVTVETDRKRLDVSSHDGRTFSVHLRGVTKSWPLDRPGENAPSLLRDFDAILTLVQVPRTDSTPNGLLVDGMVVKTFAPDERHDGQTAAPEVRP